MKRAVQGVIEVNSDFWDGEFEALCMAAKVSGRPLSCLIVQVRNEPKLWGQTMVKCVKHGNRASYVIAKFMFVVSGW
ncbi:MAG: hypothetical protein CM1200mP24_08480 [Gammaproteobacteria bacterium]|nr:MAG: hypothetical protein CM1200mP24_08480 [Gammaproteobacteria bacterium]